MKATDPTSDSHAKDALDWSTKLLMAAWGVVCALVLAAGLLSLKGSQPLW